MQSTSQKSSSSSSSSPSAASLSRTHKRGSRTTNACEACKKRKTKCSGPPGPCEACQKVDTFCHFNSRLDTRRKLAYKPNAVRERQQYILDGVLQMLKHNDDADVQAFLKMIRSDARPQEIATSLKSNLTDLQKRGVIPSMEFDETDLVSLGLQGLFSHRAGRHSLKQAGNTSVSAQTSNLDGSRVNTHQPSLLKNEFGDSPESWQNESPSEGQNDVVSFMSDVDLVSPYDSPTMMSHSEDNSPILPDQNAGHIMNHNLTNGQPAPSFRSLYSPPPSFPPLVQHSHQQNDPLQPRPGVRGFDNVLYSKPAGGQPHISNINTNHHYQVDEPQQNVKHMICLPLATPKTPLDNMCLAFREQCQTLLSSGVTIDWLNNFGRLDCELLFRPRISQDEWNIPNWSCEVARCFPSMLPGTRLAAALCIARIMAFLIEPSEQALNDLPGVLRPTELQMRRIHDVSVNFIPIPKLRDSLLHDSANCLITLGEHDYRLNWKGSWGDVGGAVLHKDGRWEYDAKIKMQEQIQETMQNKKGKKTKAVSYDSATGRRYISETYEQFCWNIQNWSVKKEILRIWPDLAGHIMLT